MFETSLADCLLRVSPKNGATGSKMDEMPCEAIMKMEDWMKRGGKMEKIRKRRTIETGMDGQGRFGKVCERV